MASVPLLQKNARSSPDIARVFPRAVPGTDGRTGSTCAPARAPARRRPRQLRVGVAERGHADAGDEIQVLPAVAVLQVRASPCVTHDGRAAVDLQDALRLGAGTPGRQALYVCRLMRHATIRVRQSPARRLSAAGARPRSRGRPAVNQHHFLRSVPEARLTGPQLGNHPGAGHAAPDQRAGRRPIQRRDRPPVLVQHAGRCTGNHEPGRSRAVPPDARPSCRHSRSERPVDAHRRCWRRPAGSRPAPRSSEQARRSRSPVGRRQTRDRSRPHRRRAAARPCTAAMPASAPVRPTARPPAALIAATKRVFTAPASTSTTMPSVAASVTRRPSTCRLAMPARASAASISRPPPCTTTSGRRRRGNRRRQLAHARRLLEQLASELQHRAGLMRAAPPARRSRTRR